MRSRFLRSLFVCAALSTFLATGGDSVRAISGGVVISQVYGAEAVNVNLSPAGRFSNTNRPFASVSC